jgi:hypothetical protein
MLLAIAAEINFEKITVGCAIAHYKFWMNDVFDAMTGNIREIHPFVSGIGMHSVGAKAKV